ncbi:synaptotagmin-11-like isoform X2 [Syngnathoides biaculeatus]|uniref:synaptotagmin-11-like isoform X2 n=1 Tax=Syngnathoides biaculeatus TaxID=300417 RepID=UPI002ADD5148|nr:synaptotagmin-11-like isoform X2 [Syngnathoides biaculeatus]
MSHYILPVHLQVLLAVLLAVFCYCVVLVFIFCCRSKKDVPSDDNEVGIVCSHPNERVTVTVTPALSTRSVRQQYEELDGDVLDNTSSKTSSSPSEEDLSDVAFDSTSSSPIHRLSSPLVPLASRKNSSHGRVSLPSLTKLVPKSRWAKARRSTVSGESFSRQGPLSPSQYGSITSSVPAKTPALLHFSLLYSSSGTLVVNILGVSGRRHNNRVFVRASLPPLCPVPHQVGSRRRSFSPELQSQSVVLQVGSVEMLRACTLRLEVYGRDFSGLRELALGVVELPCQHMDWESDTTATCTRQLSLTKTKLKKSVSSQDTWSRRKSSLCAPRSLGQLFVLLQYQAPARRIKVMVRKADQLAKLTRIPGAPDHYVVINLHHDGNVISTKETKGSGGSSPVWNAPFLFDLPPGDVTQLPLILEFIVMQARLYTKSSILGRVLIGGHVSEAGRGHWKEMCTRGPVETAHWHAIQTDG